MNRLAYISCALIALLIIGLALGRFGISLPTLELALLLAACPFGVIWLSFHLTRRSEADIDQALAVEQRERKHKENLHA
ncbi:hypothetical protein [Aquitalea pelogenes]|uniref:hypothetical protein n=1 Tax=Aquitalea pelogenes TaxID=1293573 RepID=UPI0035B00FED